MSLSERIRAAFGRNALLSQAGLARACGISRASVNAWVSGKTESIDGKFLTTAAAYLDVNAHWLSTGEGDMLPSAALSPSAPAHYSEAAEPEDGYVRLPVMAEAGAGHGCEALPEVVSYIDVLESYVRRQLGANPRTIKVLTARGNSMTGQIEDGDIMFVEQTDEFTDDGIYILTLDHLVRVKRLSLSALSQLVIIESNDGRKAEELALKDVPHRLRIQGRVIGAWSLRRFS